MSTMFHDHDISLLFLYLALANSSLVGFVCLSVCLFACLSVCQSVTASCLLHDSMSAWLISIYVQLQPLGWFFLEHNFLLYNSKAKTIWVVRIFAKSPVGLWQLKWFSYHIHGYTCFHMCTYVHPLNGLNQIQQFCWGCWWAMFLCVNTHAAVIIWYSMLYRDIDIAHNIITTSKHN